MAKPTGRPSNSIPLRLTAPQSLRIQQAAARLGIKKQELIRMAMGIGIEALKRVDWNFEKLVADAAFPIDLDGKVIPLNPNPARIPSETEIAAEEHPGKKTTYGPPGDE